MNKPYKNFSIQSCFTIFVLTIGLIVFSLNANIEEDGIYLSFAESIINDGDYNILNQVSDKLGWIVTKNYTHPSKHTTIQTPSLILSSTIEKFLNIFINKTLPQSQLSCLLLNFFSFFISFYYCKKSINFFGYRLTPTRLITFTLTSSLLYFSYFSLSVIEIFLFSISSYLLFAILTLDKKMDDSVSGLSFGLCSGLVFIAKIIYLPLFILSLIKTSQCLFKKDYKFCAQYFLGIVIVLIPFLINTFVQFGSIFFQNATVADLIFDYSIFNIIQTLKQGYFGIGGLFYTSPTYLPILIIITYFFGMRVYSKTGDFYTNLFLYLWITMCFFHSIFFVGPLIEDHYVGRQCLNALPLIILGYCILLEKLNLSKKKSFASFFILLIWQLFCIFNFLSYYNNEDHYGYAKNKFAPSLESLLETIYNHFYENIFLASQNTLFILTYSIIISLIIYSLFLKSHLLSNLYNWYIRVICFLLVSFSISNLYNSKKNTNEFLRDPKNTTDIVVANSSDIFLFNYMVDILKSQMLNAKSNEAKIRINKIRKNYYDRIKGKMIKSTPEFDKALETYNYDYRSY